MGLFRPKYKLKDGTVCESKYWWYEYQFQNRKKRINTKATSLRMAQRVVAELQDERGADKAARKAGPFAVQKRRPLSEHVAEFLSTLRSSGVTEKHTEERADYLRDFQAVTGAQHLNDLDAARAALWFEDVAERGGRRGQKLSARSLNKRRAALKQFGTWLKEERRLEYDPFVGIKRRNEAADRRHVRRALSADELAALVQTARERPLCDARKPQTRNGQVGAPCEPTAAEVKRLQLIGETRAMVYLLGATAGLRRGELSALTRGDLDLERVRVRVRASTAKNGKDADIPLREDVAAALRAYLARRERGAPADSRTPDIRPSLAGTILTRDAVP